MNGIFISVEGTDGAGKSTQIKLLTEYLKSLGRSVIVTREPGGARISEKIREIILDVDNKEMTYITEAMLYAAARAQLVGQVIKPGIERGADVICDRFVDSSMVYQGFARGLGTEFVEDINKYAVDGLMPAVTLFFDLPPEIGIERKTGAQKLDRIESEKMDFHKAVYNGYRKLMEMYPDRIKRVNANNTVENVHNDVVDIINNVLNI